MTEHSIGVDSASENLADCAAYLIEKISNADAKTAATEDLVSYCLEKDDVDRAAEFADALEDPYSRDRLLIRVVGKCIALNDDEYAFQLVEAVEEEALKLNALENAALALAARGDFEKALETAALIDHSSEALAGVAVAMADAGKEDETIEVLGEIEFASSKSKAAIGIASVIASKGNKESAKAWLDRAESYVDAIEYPEEKLRVLNELGNGYFEIGETENAVDCFKKASAEGRVLESVHRDSFLVSSAIGLLKSGETEMADETLDEVVDKTQVAACLYGFSRVFESQEETEDAAESIEEAYAILKSQSDYEVRDTNARNGMFSAVAVQFQRAGLPARAVEIAHENEDDVQRNRALAQIAQLLVMSGDTAAADEAALGVQPESERVNAFIGLSDAANTVSNREVAVGYMESAASLREEVEQFIARAAVADEIALRFDAYGEHERAVSIARSNLRLISDMKDEGGMASALIGLSRVFEKLNIEPDTEDKDILRTIVRKTSW